MKRTLIPILVALGLVACDPTTKEVDHLFNLPEELEDCSVHELRGMNGIHYMVFRCPNSSTTTANLGSKIPVTAVVVDHP